MMSHDSIMIHRVMMSMSVHPCTSGGRLLMYLSLLRDVFSFIVKFKGDTFALESAAKPDSWGRPSLLLLFLISHISLTAQLL